VNNDNEQTTNIHAFPSGIQTHGLSIQAIKVYASDRAATGTGYTLSGTSFRIYLRFSASAAQIIQSQK